MRKISKRKLSLSPTVIRALTPNQLMCAGGQADDPPQYSVRCTEPSVSICLFGCAETF